MQGSNNESNFGTIIKGMPLGLKNLHAACILCQRLSQFLFHDWFPDSLENIRQVLCLAAEKVLETEHGAETRGLGVQVDLSQEINRFVWWAISKRAKQYFVAGGGHHGPSLAAKTVCEKKSLVDLFIFFFSIPFLETIARETNRYGNKDWVSPGTGFDDDDSLSDGDGK
jgi:hypothetical protein